MTITRTMIAPGIAAIAATLLALPRTANAQARPCCTITAIDAANATATARDASGNLFEFKARSPLVLARVRPGQAIHANFSTNQVSLDGRMVCCTVTRAPGAPPAARNPATTTRAPATQAGGATRVTDAATKIPTAIANLPQVTYGEPVPVDPADRSRFTSATMTAVMPSVATPRTTAAMVAARPVRFEPRKITARIDGREVSRDLVLVRGLDGIEKAPIHPDARKILKMHVRKLRPKESTTYIVDPRGADEWFAKNPVPPELTVPRIPLIQGSLSSSSFSLHSQALQRWMEQYAASGGGGGGGGGSDCGNMFESASCFSETVQDVGEEFSDAWEHMWETANDVWKNETKKLADLWEMAEGCFVDQTLPGPKAPVRFSFAPSMTVDMEKQESKGGAEGSVKGSVTLGFPIEADFQADMNFLYVPCLPFVFRPKSIGADGSLTVGNQLAVEVTATGSFGRTFKIPPTGGPQIPLQVIPIIIGGVPVAVLDVSLYIEGELGVRAEGKANGRFAVTNSHRSRFDFECGGAGCEVEDKGQTAPTTMNESAQIEGRVSVKPGIYTALQLSLNYNVLQGRAGPLPYLLGVANGCAAVSATQQSGGASTTATNAVLTADLDWGAMIRAEALAGGQRIGEAFETKAIEERHIWFKDLSSGGSSAMIADVTGPAQAVAGQPAVVRVKMPSCYPYPEKVRYRVAFTGGATLAANSACQAQSSGYVCTSDPKTELTLTVTWQNTGAQAVAVQLWRDLHPRVFNPLPTAGRLNVNVTSTGGGAP